MTAAGTLSRDIGRTERALRALLDSALRPAGLSFPEWTALVLLDGGGPFAAETLVRRLVEGHVATDDEAHAAVRSLRARDLTEAEGAELALSAAGEALYRPLRETVDRLTTRLWGDLPAADLEATRRTLAEIARRAAAR